MGGISPIVLSWIARDQKRLRIKALKEAADSAGRETTSGWRYAREGATARSQGRTEADRRAAGETLHARFDEGPLGAIRLKSNGLSTADPGRASRQERLTLDSRGDLVSCPRSLLINVKNRCLGPFEGTDFERARAVASGM